jgi:hypothetical protein
MVNQFNTQDLRVDCVVHATGSAGTQAGLVVGLEGTRSQIPVLGIGVRAAREAQETNVYNLAVKTAELLGVPGSVKRESVMANCDYVGGGYGVPTPGMVEAVTLMARLEGTTFVKRLKAASRSELKVGEWLASIDSRGFGSPAKADRGDSHPRQVAAAAKGNDEVGKKLSAVMDDLDAYAERRPQPALRTVLEEMKELDVLGSLRQLTQDMSREAGVSIAQTEFWSDTFDRWADELVPPPQTGNCNGGGMCESLPPEVVLEAMLILEAETNLREETRVAEQLRPGLETEAFKTRAAGLASEQQGLVERVAAMVEKLVDMPDGPLQFDDEINRMKQELMPSRNRPMKFAREIGLFRQVERVMAESRGVLAASDTGRRAIAAETEAIELLLQSQFGGGGGGGGGSSPGGGGMGGTRTAAIATLGQGINAKARHEAPEEEQAIGRSGRELPEEFRDGLDAYFNVFERSRDATGRAP